MFENYTDPNNPDYATELFDECVIACDDCVHEFNLTKMKTKECCSQGLGAIDPVSWCYLNVENMLVITRLRCCFTEAPVW